MKKPLFIMLLLATTFATMLQAKQVDFKNINKRISQSILAAQAGQSSQKAATFNMSRLVSVASNRWVNNDVEIEDSTQYFFDNAFVPFDEGTVFTDILFENEWKYDSVAFYSSGGSFTSGSKRTYDLSERILSETGDDSRYTFQYNPQNLLSEFNYEEKVGVTWVTTDKYLFKYNVAGNVDTIYVYGLNNNVLELDGFQKYTYNASGKLTRSSYYQYNGANLVEVNRDEYTYNSAGNLESETYYDDSQGTFGEYAKYVYTYNVQGKLIKEESYSLDMGDVYNDTILRSYPSASLEVDTSINVYVGTQGSNYYATVIHRTVNSQGQTLLEIAKGYKFGINDPWTAASDTQNVYQYNSEGQLTYESYGSQNSWTSYRYEIYTVTTNINDFSAINATVNIFPNPTTGKITLQLSEAGNYSINIFNSIGQQVYNSTMNTQQQVIDLGNVAKGIYYVQLGNGKENISKTIVVE